MPVYKGDPLSSGDCIEHEVFRGCLMRQAPPGVQRLFLGSHDLVEFSRKVSLDIDAMEDTVVGFASLREFWATPGVWKIYHDPPLPDFWDWEASSTLVPFLHFISNCGTYWNHECKDADDLDLFIEVEQHGEKIHALLARCSTMVCCNYQYDKERTYYWRNRNPVEYEVDNFAELLQLIQQLHDRKIPSFPQVNIFPKPCLTFRNLALHTQCGMDAPPPWAGTSKHPQPLADNLASSSHHALADNLASSSPQKPSRMYVPPHLRKADSRSKADYH